MMRDSSHQAAWLIERLLLFGLQHNLLDSLDLYDARNSLLGLFQLGNPAENSDAVNAADAAHAADAHDSLSEILEQLLDYASETGLLPDNTMTYRDLLDAEIMGMLIPRPSEVVRQFMLTADQDGIRTATNNFYQFSIDSNYIRMDRIRKNKYWLAETEFGNLEITINLSKPEKDPREIALLKLAPPSEYPKCLLCIENMGYAGRVNHPARHNLRVIPLELSGEPWFFQYSPYVYYNEHSIIFNKEHVPMRISEKTFERLLIFVDQFPHYFIGSNADLPIVGGSILNHDHFQGGRHTFPMEKASIEEIFTHPDYPHVTAGIVKWPMSVIRLSSVDRGPLQELASFVYQTWRTYSDPGADILAYSNGTQIPHNTITPIARMNGNREYELDLVLRNNRTSIEHPDGIFHPHQNLHHIKKENIGLIEVMGLAVLPGRLMPELEQIALLLTKAEADAAIAAIVDNPDHPLHIHVEWMGLLLHKYGSSLSKSDVLDVLHHEAGRKFLEVLKDAGVYKRNSNGKELFMDFMRYVGFKSIVFS